MNAKNANLAAGGLLAIVVTAGLWTFAGCSKDDDAPAVDLSGPLPKIASDETKYNFGTMAAGTEKQHQFKIRNEGDAALFIKDLALACKCTKGTVAKQVLEPGESTTVDVTWKPEKRDANFQQTLELETNDPRYAPPGKFKLIIKGAVEQTVDIDPPSEFKVGLIPEEQPTVIQGVLSSRVLDKFTIHGISAENKLLTGVATPLDKGKLSELKAKCGYYVTLTLAPGISVGTFKEQVLVKTDVDGATDFQWFVSGERTGPFRFIASQGADWSSKNMLMKLGQFKAAEGNKAQVRMLVSGMGDDLEFRDVKSDVGFVKLGMKPDPANATKENKTYWLTFEVAPGSPPTTRAGENVVKIHVTTNHPKAEQVEFKVAFISL